MPNPLDALRKMKPVPSHIVQTEDPAAIAASKAQHIGPIEPGTYHPPDPGPWQTWNVPQVINHLTHLAGLSSQGEAGTVPVLPEIDPAAYNAVKGLTGKFYSRLTDAATKLPETAHPNKIISKLSSMAAPEEMQYRGLTDFLKAKGNQMVPRQDVLSHLEQNPIVLQEKVLGKVSGSHPEWPEGTSRYSDYQLPGGSNYRERLTMLPQTERHDPQALMANGWTTRIHPATPGQVYIYNPSGSIAGAITDTNPERALERFANGFEGSHPDFPKTNNYQSPHWDEPNVLVHSRTQERTLPHPTGKWEAKDFGPAEQQTENAYLFRKHGGDAYSGWGNSPEDAQQELLTSINDPAKGFTPPRGPKGRMLENIQSDWHQAGAKEGYDTPEARQAFQDLTSRQMALEDSLRDLRPDVVAAIGNMHRAGALEGIDRYNAPSLKQVLDRFGVNPDTWHQNLNGYPVSPEDRDLINHYLNLRDEELRIHRDTLNTPEVKVPDAPFKKSWPDLAIKQELYDAATSPDISWVGVTPGSESMKRGESLKPTFHDETLTNKLRDLLKPFGGAEQTAADIGESKKPAFQWNPTGGRYGTIHDDRLDPMGGYGPAIASHSGYEPDAFGNIYHISMSARPNPQPAMDALRAGYPAHNVQAPVFNLTPELKAAIAKRGFPIMALMGLMKQRSNQSEGQ